MRRQTFGQHADARDIDKGFAGGRLALVVLAQAAVAGQPGDGAFDHPATWQDHKAFGPCGPTDDLQQPATVLLDPSDDVFIAAVGPDQFETAPAIMDILLDAFEQRLQSLLPTRSIWQICPM